VDLTFRITTCRVIWRLTSSTFYVLSLNSLLQILLDCAVASLPRGISLLPSWPDGNTVHSLPHSSKFDFRPLFTYHEPTRGRVLVQLCAELVIFLGPIS